MKENRHVNSTEMKSVIMWADVNKHEWLYGFPLAGLILVGRERERNVLFNDALNTF